MASRRLALQALALTVVVATVVATVVAEELEELEEEEEEEEDESAVSDSSDNDDSRSNVHTIYGVWYACSDNWGQPRRVFPSSTDTAILQSSSTRRSQGLQQYCSRVYR